MDTFEHRIHPEREDHFRVEWTVCKWRRADEIRWNLLRQQWEDKKVWTESCERSINDQSRRMILQTRPDSFWGHSQLAIQTPSVFGTSLFASVSGLKVAAQNYTHCECSLLSSFGEGVRVIIREIGKRTNEGFWFITLSQQHRLIFGCNHFSSLALPDHVSEMSSVGERPWGRRGISSKLQHNLSRWIT